MTLVEITSLGVIQGITEFLPVSSSGHLLATRILFGISDIDGTSFDSFLHLGTLCAVLVYYWKVWWGIGSGLLGKQEEDKDKRELLGKLVIATIPAAIIGYFFRDSVLATMRSPYFLAGSLFFTAIVLLLSDVIFKNRASIKRVGFKDAWYVGLVQMLALLPGVSRSGVTIAAGRWRGLSRAQAVTFSMLMSAPIIMGAGLSSVPSLIDGGVFSATQMLVGFITSFISGLLGINILIRIVNKMSFAPFAIYLIFLAMLLIYVG